MKTRYCFGLRFLFAVSFVLLQFPSTVVRAGIPEPGLLLYGAVVDQDSGQRITWGTLTITCIEQGTGKQLSLATELADLKGGYSYMLQVPFQSSVAMQSVPTDVFELKSSAATYGRLSHLDGLEADESSVGESDVVSQVTRGVFRRVDLQVTLGNRDTDGDLIADSYELANDLDPTSTNGCNDDHDADGLTDLQEFHSGTRANDPSSLLRIEQVSSLQGQPGSLVITWQSAPDRSYTISRSAELEEAFTAITSGLPATPPLNTFTDAPPAQASAVFYRVTKE